MKRVLIALLGICVGGSAFAYQTFPSWGMMYMEALSGPAKCVHGGGHGLTPFVEPCDMSNIYQFVRWDSNGGLIHVWDNSCMTWQGDLSNLVDDVCCEGCTGGQENWYQNGSGQVWNALTGDCIACDTSGGGIDCIGAPCLPKSTEYINMDTVRGYNPYPYVSFTMQPYFPARPNLVLDVHYNGRANGTPVDVTAYNGSPAQFWWYEPSTMLIHLTDSDNMCLDKPGGQNADGTKLQIWSCWGGANQQWVKVSPNQWVNVESGTCLDAPNGQEDVDAWVYGCWGGLNQQWNGPHG